MTEAATVATESAEMLVFEGSEYWWAVTGSRAQLCESGHCVPSHFPTGRKRASYGHDSANRWWSVEAMRGGLWRFRIDKTAAESKAWAEAETVRQARAGAPKSPEEWRSRKVAFLAGVRTAVLGYLTDAGPGSAGLTLSSDGLCEVESLLAALGRTVEQAQVVHHAAGASCTDDTQDFPMPKMRAPLRLVASAP